MLRLIAVSLAIAVAVSGNRLDSSLSVSTQNPATALDFIDTGIENALSALVRDRRRRRSGQSHLRPRAPSPNRAAGHIHFLLHARPGAKLTLEF